jgi:CBS domain containing-hemolysin-like protein
MILTRSEETGHIDADEVEMIESVFELGDTTAREVMIPRPDVESDDVETIGGFVFSRPGRVPEVGDQIDADGYVIRGGAVGDTPGSPDCVLNGVNDGARGGCGRHGDPSRTGVC